MTPELDLALIEAMASRLEEIADAAKRLETLAGAADCRLRRRIMAKVNAVRLAAYELYTALAELTAATCGLMAARLNRGNLTFAAIGPISGRINPGHACLS